jgi:hypothetical protein
VRIEHKKLTYQLLREFPISFKASEMEAISPLSFTNSKSLCEKKKMHTDILKINTMAREERSRERNRKRRVKSKG